MIWMDGFGDWVRKAKLHLNDISEVHKDRTKERFYRT